MNAEDEYRELLYYVDRGELRPDALHSTMCIMGMLRNGTLSFIDIAEKLELGDAADNCRLHEVTDLALAFVRAHLDDFNLTWVLFP